MMTRIAVLAALLLMPTACAAESTWIDGHRYICADAYHQIGCRRVVRHRVKPPEVRAWRQEEQDQDERRVPGCSDQKPIVSVVGTEHLSVDNARLAADGAWRRQVRYLHGERYADLKRAYKLKRACTQSSTGDSITAKVLEKISEDAGVLHRCEVRASPCRVEPEEEGK